MKTLEPDRKKAAEMANGVMGIVIATSSSVKKGIVGMGGCAQDTLFNRAGGAATRYAVTLGTREEQNPYTAELLKQGGNSVDFIWIPAETDFALGSEAKAVAQSATKQRRAPDLQPHQAKSTTIRLAVAKQQQGRRLPEDVGKFSKAMDMALPGKHTRELYDKLKRREASVLAQLRTGMARLNGFLSRIGAAESDQCACGHARETVEHFLLRCVRWTALREGMLQCTTTRRGSLSFYLGGKAPSDPKQWSPDMKAVRAVIKYAMATGRLDPDDEQGPSQPQ